MSTFQVELKDLRALGVVFAADEFSVVLADGRTLIIPLAWFPRLFHATPGERANWRWDWRRHRHPLARPRRRHQR
jgi:hypothetical protein